MSNPGFDLSEMLKSVANVDLTQYTANELLEMGGGVPENSMTRFGPTAMHAARRALSQTICGGVFDRFPQLRMVLVELRADWLPATLAHLSRQEAAAEGIAAFTNRGAS